MILSPDEILDHKETVGSKAFHLKILQDLRFNVPQFIVIPNETIKKIWKKKDSNILDQIVHDIMRSMAVKNFAVRSSAFNEDGSKNSFAGQFKTQLGIYGIELKKAIVEIIQHALEEEKIPVEKFSLIVQEYIEADFSGITFTRNPLGNREMIIEYHAGIGEEIVSGKIKPQRIALYWHQKATNELPDFQNALHGFQTLESFFKHPQDIEWCIKNNEWYFLQTRPITNFTKKQYEECIYLDKILPKRFFFFSKTGISEVAPRPTPLTLSILKTLYAENGSVDKVYKKYGIHYRPDNFLKIIGNELYTDQEKSLKTLLPAYSYKNSNFIKPKICKLKGLFTSIKNVLGIQRISLHQSKNFSLLLEKKLQSEEETHSLEKKFSLFFQDYELIFEINLCAEKALKNLEFALKKEHISVLKVLSEPLIDSEQIEKLDIKNNNWQGNCLEIADESRFYQHQKQKIVDNTVKNWFLNVPEIKKLYLKKIIIQAREFNNLREYGRWLTIKHIHELRNILFNRAKKNNFKKSNHIYFFTHQELVNESEILESEAENRTIEYEKYQKYEFPFELKSTISTETNKKNLGVSPGKAQGKLVELKNIDQEKDDIILYTPLLTPDLTQYFDQIKGIVSTQGGMLSHLAIIAREKGIPVIVNFIPYDLLGKNIEINGNTGEIKKI